MANSPKESAYEKRAEAATVMATKKRILVDVWGWKIVVRIVYRVVKMLESMLVMMIVESRIPSPFYIVFASSDSETCLCSSSLQRGQHPLVNRTAALPDGRCHAHLREASKMRTDGIAAAL